VVAVVVGEKEAGRSGMDDDAAAVVVAVDDVVGCETVCVAGTAGAAVAVDPAAAALPFRSQGFGGEGIVVDSLCVEEMVDEEERR